MTKENPARTNAKSGGKILQVFQDPQSGQAFCNPHLVTTKRHLKSVFWPNIFVGASFQILDNQQVACGLKIGSAAPVPAKPRFSRDEEGILNQNPIFEMPSNKKATRFYIAFHMSVPIGGFLRYKWL